MASLSSGSSIRRTLLVYLLLGGSLLLAAVLAMPPAAEIERAARACGLIVNAVGPDAIRVAPPLTITDDDIHDALDRWDAACGEVATARASG